jgi:hypothetical protein
VSEFVSVKIVEHPPDAEEIVKQINFGTVVGLTRTALQGQEAVRGALRGNFTLRGTWFEQQNRFGIKTKRATPRDMTAEIMTRADWLLKHETGQDKTSIQGHSIAVPTDQVRRNKRLIIPRGQRPLGLGTKAFVLQTKHGPVLAQRITRGKRKGVIILYGLERKVKIQKKSVFYEPIDKVVRRRGQENIEKGIMQAVASSKYKGRWKPASIR